MLVAMFWLNVNVTRCGGPESNTNADDVTVGPPTVSLSRMANVTLGGEPTSYSMLLATAKIAASSGSGVVSLIGVIVTVGANIWFAGMSTKVGPATELPKVMFVPV